jgi:ABC-type phosphate transport system substrate-binding protein
MATNTERQTLQEPTNPSGFRQFSKLQLVFLIGLLAFLANLSQVGAFLLDYYQNINLNPPVFAVGSNTILGDGIGVAKAWQSVFNQTHALHQLLFGFYDLQRPGVKLLIDGQGSDAGVQQVLAGEGHILFKSKPLTPEQVQQLQQAGLTVQCAAPLGYDVVVFVTNLDNQVPGVSLRDLKSILNGSITNWSQVGGADLTIKILARGEEDSGTTQFVLQQLTGSPQFKPALAPQVIDCGQENDQCLDMALSTPGALYWVSSAWLHTQPSQYIEPILIRDGLLEPISPFAENFAVDDYTNSLVRPLYMYVLSGSELDPEATATAREFFLFIRSIKGQEILETHHFFTYLRPPTGSALELPAGFGVDEVTQVVTTCQ